LLAVTAYANESNPDLQGTRIGTVMEFWNLKDDSVVYINKLGFILGDGETTDRLRKTGCCHEPSGSGFAAA
jgi:hypothetical protein